MNGDLIFLDFAREKKEKESSDSFSQEPLPKGEKQESKVEKIQRLTSQIESGDYRVDPEKVAESILEDLSGLSDSD